MPNLALGQASPSWQVDAESSSEAASLQGHKAMTPIIAGSVCGGVLGIAWIIGFIVYFMKKRKRRARRAKEEAGLVPPKKKEKPTEKIIVPPDPAILLGQRRPGENAFLDDNSSPKNVPPLSTAQVKTLKVDQVAISSESPSFPALRKTIPAHVTPPQ